MKLVKFTNLAESVRLSITGIISNSLLVLAPGQERIVNNSKLTSNYEAAASYMAKHLKVSAAEEGEVETPEDGEDKAEADSDAAKVALEALAQRIYETASDHPDYVPWVNGGNSTMQDEARAMAASHGEAALDLIAEGKQRELDAQQLALEEAAHAEDALRTQAKVVTPPAEPTEDEKKAIEDAAAATARQVKIKELVDSKDKPSLIKICEDSGLDTGGDKTALATRIVDSLKDL